MPPPAADLRSFCRRVLEAGDLAHKLAPPVDGEGRALPDDEPGAALDIRTPARDPQLALVTGAARLPRPGELSDPDARAVCLARFAHHELMAVELFAWALLRWPELPAALRRALATVLAEEQSHCKLYLDRLVAHGSQLGDHALSGYFWRHAPAMAASPHGPSAFLAGMGAGDEQSAQVCERVHAEEIGHVALAARWLPRLAPAPPGDDDELVARYEACVPFPLAAARAKGRRFDAAARRRAGLSEAFIEHVRRARSSSERRSGAEHPPA